jgi:isochorismate hydrolase
MINAVTFPRDTSALLIIDMLYYFAQEGDLAYQQRFSQIAKNINQLRTHFVHVIYANTWYESAKSFEVSPLSKKMKTFCIDGTKEAQVINDLAPRNHDLVIHKGTNDSFFNTELEEVLKQRNIENLILVGVHTHVCIMLTAAAGFFRNFNIIVPEECVTTINLSRHDFGLDYINRHVGQTISINTLSLQS